MQRLQKNGMGRSVHACILGGRQASAQAPVSHCNLYQGAAAKQVPKREFKALSAGGG